jgi:hypothetical protein
MPERRSSSSSPIALRSLAAHTAVGRLLRPTNSRAASMVSSVFAEDENADEVSRYQLATTIDYVAKYR